MKSSPEYIEIRKMLEDGYAISKVNIQLGTSSGRISMTVSNSNGESKEFDTTSDDVIMMGFRWKSLHDKNGNVNHGLIRDTEEFYNNIEFLTDRDGSKIKSARDRIIKGEIQPSYVPHDLIEELLTDETGSYKKFLPLRDDYYEILWSHTYLAKEIYDGEQQLRKKGDKYKERLMLVYGLMSKAFRQDPNFLKNYQSLQSFVLVDIYDQLQRISAQLSESKHQMEMLVKAGGMKPSVGLKYPIEDYASKGEILINFMNIIRAAIEIVGGNKCPDLKKKSTENWEIILKSEYKDITGKFDPRIRHGKSHQSYVIDEESATIKIYQLGRRKKLLVEYGFEEFREMHQDLIFVLQTVTIALCMEHAVISALMLRSGEYKSLLISLGNFKPLKS
jgi:hypothetical protein